LCLGDASGARDVHPRIWPFGAQLIGAEGIFATPSFGKAVDCWGIEIKVTLAATPDQRQGGEAVTMTVEPLTAAAPTSQLAVGVPYSPEYVDGLALREALLGLRCSIPIGTTGFVLKSVEGTILLEPGSTTVSLKADVATAAKVLLGLPVLAADGRIIVRNHPFLLGLEGGLQLFKFPVASGDAAIWDQTDLPAGSTS
jgi:hypothetical protein